MHFQLWRLAIFKPVGVQRHNVPHFKGLIILHLDFWSSRAWQYFYYLPRPLEKGHFTPKNGYCVVFCEYSCIDRLAHWKALLVDPIFKFEPLPAVSHALSVQFRNNPSIKSHNLCWIGLKWTKNFYASGGVWTTEPWLMRPRLYHGTTVDIS